MLRSQSLRRAATLSTRALGAFVLLLGAALLATPTVPEARAADVALRIAEYAGFISGSSFL